MQLKIAEDFPTIPEKCGIDVNAENDEIRAQRAELVEKIRKT